MDCCYSGLMATRRQGLDPSRADYLDKIYRLPVRQIITAGGSDETVLEEGGRGLFSHVFLQGLKGEAGLEGRGYLTAMGLGDYVKERVHLESGGRHTPLFGTMEGQGEFVFTLGGVGDSAEWVDAAVYVEEDEPSWHVEQVPEKTVGEFSAEFSKPPESKAEPLIEIIERPKKIALLSVIP
ncbi:MAG: hypothetical protein GY731_16230 [Gammaproteobacteria bacterium]|nr:hypothetical protein [Gammaproteobacteria bacterium]